MYLPAFLTPLLSQFTFSAGNSLGNQLGNAFSNYLLVSNTASSSLPMLAPGLVPDVRKNNKFIKLLEAFQQQTIATQEFNNKLLQLQSQWQVNQIKLELEKLKKTTQIQWEKDNFFSKISRQETVQILQNSTEKHSLLILAAPPDISKECPQNFHNNLPKELHSKLVRFLNLNYNEASSMSPVKFYGDYFKEPISEVDISRLREILGTVPTVILYIDMSDYEVSFNIAFWGVKTRAVIIPLGEWDWEQAQENFKQAGKDDKQSVREVRKIIVAINKLLAAYIADWYYLSINPTYQPQIFNLKSEFIGDGFDGKLLEYVFQDLIQWQQKQLEAYQQQLKLLALEQKQGEKFTFEVITVNKYGKIINCTTGRARQKIEDLGNNIKLEMVYIPGGSFIMGSPKNEVERDSDESPEHQVTLPPFYISKYPITQDQYQTIMGKKPAYFRGGNRPVEQVTWYNSVEFCRQLSEKTGKTYRLPTESQWEYACRAGTTTPYYFGPTITTDLVNYNGKYTYGNAPTGKYRKETTDVGSFPPNAFGLYDMHGNVYEWCQDVWHNNYKGAPSDGSSQKIGVENGVQVLRGGSWNNNPRRCRSANRSRNYTVICSNYRGFRVVLSAE